MSLIRGRPEELTEINPSNPLQTQPEIGIDYHNGTSAVSPNAHHQYEKTFFCSPLTSLPNQYLAAQTLEDQHFEDRESQQPFFDCLAQVWHQCICHYARHWKSIAMKLINPLLWQQFNILKKS
jgi:hypothetical protein